MPSFNGPGEYTTTSAVRVSRPVRNPACLLQFGPNLKSLHIAFDGGYLYQDSFRMWSHLKVFRISSCHNINIADLNGLVEAEAP
eukprot:scaffold109649_cov34-Prasinocladus_malaysianus.AAC.1